MNYKRHTKYYFVNKATKALDSLRVIDIVEDGFVYLHNEEYKFCSYKNAEGKLYESDHDPELLKKLGKCRQSCYYNLTHRCNTRYASRCPCPIFIHVLDPEANSKIAAKKSNTDIEPEHTDLELYPFGDR